MAIDGWNQPPWIAEKPIGERDFLQFVFVVYLCIYVCGVVSASIDVTIVLLFLHQIEIGLTLLSQSWPIL